MHARDIDRPKNQTEATLNPYLKENILKCLIGQQKNSGKEIPLTSQMLKTKNDVKKSSSRRLKGHS